MVDIAVLDACSMICTYLQKRNGGVYPSQRHALRSKDLLMSRMHFWKSSPFCRNDVKTMLMTNSSRVLIDLHHSSAPWRVFAQFTCLQNSASPVTAWQSKKSQSTGGSGAPFHSYWQRTFQPNAERNHADKIRMELCVWNVSEMLNSKFVMLRLHAAIQSPILDFTPRLAYSTQ